MRRLLAISFVAACGGASTTAKPPAVLEPWPVPAGWKHETIPFPLEFAPSLAHKGVEELRFAPGMFDPAAPGYWSYAFVWRTTDAAALDATALGAELTAYFRGLLVAVDGDKHRIASPDDIVVHANADGARFALAGHIIDAFASGTGVDLTGTAERRACGSGALWVFVFAPPATKVRAQLDELAKQAACDQPEAPKASGKS
jgi:hypothetical protein